MNTLKLTQTIDDFFKQLNDAEPFITAISIFSKYLNKIFPQIEAISEGGGKIIQNGTNLHSLFVGFSEIPISINNRKFFQGFDNFNSSVDKIKSTWHSNHNHFQKLQDDAEKFADLYGSYLSNKTPPSAYKLIFSARELQHDLNNTLELLASIRSTFIPQEIPNNDESIISIILPEQLNLKNFALRLLALQEIYSELCQIFSVSEIDSPLRIQKIESGSLWVKLFGNTKVTEFMADSIKSTASYVYRNFTKEGKLASIPMKVEAIDSLLGLTKRLEDSGINTFEMKSNIEKTALTISKEIAVLIEGQSKITVNEETLSVNAELENKLINSLNPTLLTSNNDGR